MNDYERIAKVIKFVDENRRKQPSLNEMARLVSLSPAYFQRLFVRWAGVSPKKFLQLLTASAVRQRLLEGRNVLETALNEGLSGPGRLHDLTVNLEAATPGELKSGGDGWTIEAGFADSPFGDCLIANSPRGICRLDFVEERDRRWYEHELADDWGNAEIRWSNTKADSVARRIFRRIEDSGSQQTLRCFVQGSQFQVQVWRALLRIPAGQLVTYKQIAVSIGKPDASRAVGSAIGNNPIGYLIPCHRVIRRTGVVGQYRWGEIRKQAVIAHEASANAMGERDDEGSLNSSSEAPSY